MDKLKVAMGKIITICLIILALAGALAAQSFRQFSTSQNKELAQNTPRNKVIGILSLSTNTSHESMLAGAKKQLLQANYSPTYIQEDIRENTAFPEAAKKLRDQKVDVIIANSTPAVEAAFAATSTIPIVFAGIGDPVGNKIVESLDSSGNNATGVSSLSVDLTVKRLNMLKSVTPNLKKVYFIYQPGETASENSRRKVLDEAKKLSITLIEKGATTAAELKDISKTLRKTEAQAITFAASAIVWTSVDNYIEAQNRESIPLIGVDRTMAEKGAALSYGPNYNKMGEQVGKITAQILDGIKPQYIPIQRPDNIELIINDKIQPQLRELFIPAFNEKANEVIK